LVVEEINIHVHVSALRKALEENAEGQTFLLNVSGRTSADNRRSRVRKGAPSYLANAVAASEPTDKVLRSPRRLEPDALLLTPNGRSWRRVQPIAATHSANFSAGV
jgi:hypothetical protein